MPALAFTDQSERLNRTLTNALNGTTYVSSHPEENGRHFVVIARRDDGKRIGVRFRACEKQPQVTLAPEARLQLRSVGSRVSLMRFLPFGGLFVDRKYAHVRIAAGAATLEVVCQDAEWWEEDAAPGTR